MNTIKTGDTVGHWKWQSLMLQPKLGKKTGMAADCCLGPVPRMEQCVHVGPWR